MITKTRLINSLEKLPENLSIDDLVDHVILMEKVQKGLDDVDNGKINTKSEAQKKLNKWLTVHYSARLISNTRHFKKE